MESIILKLLEALGINAVMASILVIFIIIIFMGMAVTIGMMIKMSAMNNRINMHADHFDVMRTDMDRNLDISRDSNRLSVKAVGLYADSIKS